MLLEHPAVAEAAAFGLPDAKYGEEVWAAVVLKGDCDAERPQAFCRTRLADFKVPKVIRIASALPKNETGKIESGAILRPCRQRSATRFRLNHRAPIAVKCALVT